MKIGLYLNGTLIWKCSSWAEFEQIEKEQREYHKGEEVVITHKYLQTFSHCVIRNNSDSQVAITPRNVMVRDCIALIQFNLSI